MEAKVDTDNRHTSPDQTIIRVLLADRHQVVRYGIREELAKTDDMSVVGEATDGHEAIQLVRQLQPDVLILDAYLPAVSGVQVIRQLKNQFAKTKTKYSHTYFPAILVLSAYSDRQYVWSLLTAGVKGYLLKTETLPTIVAGIRQVACGQSVLSTPIQTLLVDLIPKLNQELSSSELKVLALLAQGLSNKEIAQLLEISEGTVKIHLNNTYRKVPLIRSRAEAVAWARINRIVD
jgi:DNA-binding NarL/FixJ family response regulator